MDVDCTTVGKSETAPMSVTGTILGHTCSAARTADAVITKNDAWAPPHTQ